MLAALGLVSTATAEPSQQSEEPIAELVVTSHLARARDTAAIVQAELTADAGAGSSTGPRLVRRSTPMACPTSSGSARMASP